MIIEYEARYIEEVKTLLGELQQHIKDIDIEGYNKVGINYKHLYFKKIFEEVNRCAGKILLYKVDEEIVGVVIGLVNNDERDNDDSCLPRIGRVTELVVSKRFRAKQIGTALLRAIEDYLISIGCESILLGVLAYNEEAIEFYLKNGYHSRTIEMIKCL